MASNRQMSGLQQSDRLSTVKVPSVPSNSEDPLTDTAARKDSTLYPETDTTRAGEGLAEGEIRGEEEVDVTEPCGLLSFLARRQQAGDSTAFAEPEAESERSPERGVEVRSLQMEPNEEWDGASSWLLVKKLSQFKQALALSLRVVGLLAANKQGGNCHLRSIQAGETGSSDVLVAGVQTIPCYQDNRFDHENDLLALFAKVERHQIEGSARKGGKLHDYLAKDSDSKITSLSKNKSENDFAKIHVCMFCGQGFIGGTPCGKLCNQLATKNIDDHYIKKLEQHKVQGKNVVKKKQNQPRSIIKNYITGKQFRNNEPKEESLKSRRKDREFWGLFPIRKKYKVIRPSNLYIGNPNNLIKQENATLLSQPEPFEKKTKRHLFVLEDNKVPEYKISVPSTSKASGFGLICKPHPLQNAATQTPEHICAPLKKHLTYDCEKNLPCKSKSESLPRKKFHFVCTKFESSDEEASSSEASVPPVSKTHCKGAVPNTKNIDNRGYQNYMNDYDKCCNDKEYERSYFVREVEVEGHGGYPFDDRNNFRRNLTSVDNYRSSSNCLSKAMSPSSSYVSYLSIGGNSQKRSLFPHISRGLRNCYPKISCYRKRKTVFSYPPTGYSRSSTATSEDNINMTRSYLMYHRHRGE